MPRHYQPTPAGTTWAAVACLAVAACSATLSPTTPSTSPGASDGSGATTVAGATSTVGPADASASPTPTPAPTVPLRSVEPGAKIEVGAPPRALHPTKDGVWVFTRKEAVLVDPETNRPGRRVRSHGGASEFSAVGFGSLWSTDFEESVVRRVDIASGDLVATIPVGANPEGIAVAHGAIWVADHRGGTVSRIDPRTNRVTSVFVGPAGPAGPSLIGVGAGSLWVGIPNIASVVEVDPSARKAVATILVPPPAIPCHKIGVGGGRVWMATCEDPDGLAVIDVDQKRAVGTVPVRGSGGQPVFAAGRAWVPVAPFRRSEDPWLAGIDPETLEIVDGIRLPDEAWAAVVAFGSIWLAHEDTRSVTRLPVSALGDE